MIIKLALRSLATRPLRSGVLAAGFGLGIAVMASLLGVGEVILEQARSPALAGGGDLVVAGNVGAVDNARFLMANVLGARRVSPAHGRRITDAQSRALPHRQTGRGGAGLGARRDSEPAEGASAIPN